MLYLFHGEDLVGSRQALVKLVEAYGEAVFWWDKSYEPGEWLKMIPATSLLAPQMLLVFENDNQQPFNSEPFLKRLENLDEATATAFWVGARVPANGKFFKWLRQEGSRIFSFSEKIPKTVFPFLDALGKKDGGRSFLELEKLLAEGNDPIYILTMIVYQLRNLAMVLADPVRAKKCLHSFVYSKLKSQAKNFSLAEVTNFFNQAFEADLALKTSPIDRRLVLSRVVATVVN